MGSIRRFIIHYRLPIVVAVHLFLVAAANYLAFWLRFDGDIPREYSILMNQLLPVLLLVRAAVFYAYRLYKGLWRYTGIWDLWNILFATFIGTFVFFLLVHFVLGLRTYPRSVFIIDSILLICFLGGIRLPWRIHRELKRSKKQGKRVLIYGAGDAGEMIVRDMNQHPDYHYDPVGFVDDDSTKVGQQIHGIRVLGARKSLPDIIRKERIDEVIVAVPSASPVVLREILQSLRPFNIPIKTLPNIRDILDEKLTVNQIRNLSVEDLLDRVPVQLDLTPVKRMLEGKRVLVTGAGGSIGSELCRQIIQLHPKELLLFERYENGLYEIMMELNRDGAREIVRPIIGDVTARNHVNSIFQMHTPDVVFHAAAHKHVPLMESNLSEAVKNNVIGTRILAKAAVQHGAEKFVLISTDKAVNPTSVMGASKRVAEMIIKTMAESSMTSFVSVRFGNVLASKGSVIPLFLEQIKRGGPVTVTHPDMQRYFMLIPEAVQLVLLASAMGGDSETYVLRMGEQINVAEMARNLIRLSGLIPDVDIPIVFTGIRPGEKMYEELIAEDEIGEPSSINEIMRIRRKVLIDGVEIRKRVHRIEQACRSGNQEVIMQCLRQLIPGFKMDMHPVSLSHDLVHDSHSRLD